jgi:uncharacterized protein (DUF302 family)
MEYHISKFVDYGFSEAIERATAALKEEGFGILTEIDAQATIKKKLDQDFRPYMILGACNPQLASQALHLEDKIGVLLPCNVVVQQHDDGRVEVSAMNPGIMAQATGNSTLEELSQQATERIRRALDAL